jgi:hypothetical protein
MSSVNAIASTSMCQCDSRRGRAIREKLPEVGIVVRAGYVHVEHAVDLLDRGRQRWAQLGARASLSAAVEAVPTILNRSCRSIGALRGLSSDYRHRRPDGAILPSSTSIASRWSGGIEACINPTADTSRDPSLWLPPKTSDSRRAIIRSQPKSTHTDEASR